MRFLSSYHPWTWSAWLLLAVAGTAEADPVAWSYSGRLTAANGAPLAGPTSLRVQFFRAESGGVPLLGTSLEYGNVELADGVFQLTLALSAADLQTVFDGSSPVFLELTDTRRLRTYPRQKFGAVPMALRVPVDGQTLVFNADGALGIKAPLTVDQVPKSDGSGGVVWSSLPGGGDMLQATYDADGDGKVASAATADDATRLGNQLPSYYLDAAHLTGTVADARIPAAVARDSEIPASTDALPAGSTNLYMSTAEKAKLSGIAAGADVTDPTSVAAAGGVMDSDFGSNGLMKRTGPGTYASVTDNSAGWNQAFAWGDHAAAGYLTVTSLAAGIDDIVAKKDLRLDDDDGSAGVTLKASDVTTNSYTLTFPPVVGGSGQLLATDASGQLSWVSAAGDMLQATYDADGDGKVASAATADDATRLGNQLPSYYLDAAHLTGTVADARIPAAVARDSEIPASTDALPAGSTNLYMSTAEKAKLSGIAAGADVTDPTSVAAAGGVMDSDFGSNGLMKRTGPGIYASVADNSSNWDLAYSERAQWDGGPTNLDAAAARTSLGLGSIATQAASGVAITGGTLSGLSGVSVTSGSFVGAFIDTASATIDWSAANIQRTSAASGILTFASGSMVNGTSYTLIIDNATGGTYTLSSPDVVAWKCRPVCSSGQVTVSAGKETVLTVIKAGTTAYVGWMKDF